VSGFEEDLGLAQPRHVEIGDIWIDVSVQESHEAEAEVSEHPVEAGADIADHIRPLPRVITIEGIVTNHPIEVPQSHAGGATLDGSALSIEVALDQSQRVEPNTIQIEGEPSVGVLGLVPGVDQGVAILGALQLNVTSRVQLAAEQYNTNPFGKTTLAVTALHFSQPFNRVEAVNAALLQIVDESRLVKVVTAIAVYTSVAITKLEIKRGSDIGRDQLKFTASCRVLRIVQTQTAKLPTPRDKRALPAQSQGKQPTVPVVDPTVTDSISHKLLDLF
jgi:hypothetical protein